jgi:pimeloyl-ACP methyl ester carboxylesterase
MTGSQLALGSPFPPVVVTPSRGLGGATPVGQERTSYWRGWRIRYRVLLPQDPAARQRSPLLLLHGFGASLDQWRYNLAPLAAERPVYALDLLGFGGSQKAATTFGTDLWVAQVHDFWTRWLGQQPMVLVGHSLGALVALTTAIAHPQAVQRLVLLTLPAAREELMPAWADALARPVERLFSTPLLIRPLFYWARRRRFIRAALKGIYQVPERVDGALVEQFVVSHPRSRRGPHPLLSGPVPHRGSLHPRHPNPGAPTPPTDADALGRSRSGDSPHLGTTVGAPQRSAHATGHPQSGPLPLRRISRCD